MNDGDELTHLGQSLSDIKHFDKFEVESDDGDDDDVNGFKKSGTQFHLSILLTWFTG